MKYLVWVLALGCASSSTAATEEPNGNDAASSGASEPANEAQGGLVAVTGTFSPPTEAERAEQERRAAEQQTARAAAREAFMARCAPVQLTVGLPPAPPAHPSSLDPLHAVYTANLAQAPTPPADTTMNTINAWTRSTFAQWVRDSTNGLQTLQQAGTDIAPNERHYAAGWYAHSLATFIEHFHGVPTPDNVQADPELRELYLDALRDVTAPLIEQSAQALEAIDPSSDWGAWRAQMTAWLEQERCALR